MTIEFSFYERFDHSLMGRIRVAIFKTTATKIWNELEENFEFLKMNTPHGPFANSIFFDAQMESLSIPVTGPKRALVGVSKNYIVSDIEFRELESFKTSEIEQKKLRLDEFSDLLRSFLQKNPQLIEKKLLLELNSKYLALHFFL